jgi:hypothetical protein
MTSPTFGQLRSAADEYLKAAEADPSVAGMDPGPDLLRMTGALRRMVSRFCARGDVAGLPPADSTLWEQAAAELAAIFELAEEHLASHVDADSPTPLTPTADALVAASDLLATHFDGQDGERSEWSEVIASEPVIRALTEESATWARRLAPWVRWLAEHNDMAPPLLAANRDLQLASRATVVASKAQPITDDDRTLLYAIPAAAMTERVPPREGESVTELCAGIACTAERLRSSAFHTVDRAAWSPSVSARTWQYAATAAAVTTDIAKVLLRTLADSWPDLCGASTADKLVAARDAWQNLARALASVATDTPPALGPESTDLSDLVIRLGRLAFNNPRWTPQHPAEPRSPAHLSGDGGAAVNVLAALHQSIDALAVIAVGHWSAVTTAIRAGRLYVPTRSLPEGYDVPRRYAQMPPDRADILAGNYAAAASISTAAADPLASLVLTAGGPSRHIALARQAIRREETVKTPAAPQPPTPPDPRLTRRLAALGVADIDLALRAAVIDKAAAKLIGEADHRAHRKNAPNRGTGHITRSRRN